MNVKCFYFLSHFVIIFSFVFLGLIRMAVEVADAPAAVTSLQESTVKLFNRWSFDEVQVSILILFFSDIFVWCIIPLQFFCCYFFTYQ